MGSVAVVMLLVGGNDALTGLQSLTILVAAPFMIIMGMLCVALVRDLRDDPEVHEDTDSRPTDTRPTGIGDAPARNSLPAGTTAEGAAAPRRPEPDPRSRRR